MIDKFKVAILTMIIFVLLIVLISSCNVLCNKNTDSFQGLYYSSIKKKG